MQPEIKSVCANIPLLTSPIWHVKWSFVSTVLWLHDFPVWWWKVMLHTVICVHIVSVLLSYLLCFSVISDTSHWKPPLSTYYCIGLYYYSYCKLFCFITATISNMFNVSNALLYDRPSAKTSVLPGVKMDTCWLFGTYLQYVDNWIKMWRNISLVMFLHCWDGNLEKCVMFVCYPQNKTPVHKILFYFISL